MTCEFTENHLFFEIDGRHLISRMIDAQFPAYERVIPQGNDKRIEFERDRLLRAVRRVALLSSERSRAIRFQIDTNSVEVRSSSPEVGEAKEVLEVEYAGGAADLLQRPVRHGFSRCGRHGQRRSGVPRRDEPGRHAAGRRRRLRVHLRHHADAGLASRAARATVARRRPPAGAGPAFHSASPARPGRSGRAGPTEANDPARTRSSRQPAGPGRGHPAGAARRGDVGRLSRRQDQGPRGARGGAQASGDVHRVDRRSGPAPPRLRGRRQLDRRGAGRPLRPHRGDRPHRRLGDDRRQRARHPGRPARQRPVRGRGRHDRAARGRQVRQQELQGVGRPARRRRVGGQRPLRVAAPRDLPRRARLPAELRARAADERARADRHDEAPRHGGEVQARLPDLRDHRLQLRHAGPPAARARLPERRRDHRPRRRAERQEPHLQLRGRDPLVRGVHQQEQDRRQRPAAAHARGARRHRGRDRAPVERRLRGDGLLVRQQHQHPGGRDAPVGLPLRPDAHHQRVRQPQQPGARPQGEHRGRRHPGRAGGRRQREDPAPAVRGPDEDEARQHGGEGHRRGDPERPPGGAPRGEPGRGQADRQQGDRRGAGPRGGAQGPRPGAAEGRPRQQLAARQAGRLPGARSGAERALHRGGRVGRRVRQAGPRPALPGRAADQGEDPQRRAGALRQDARQRRDQDDDRGARLRHRPGGLRPVEAPLPPHHHHDRRRRRRLAHPDAAVDVLLPPDARAHRARARPHRAAAALPREAGAGRAVHQGRPRAGRVPDSARGRVAGAAGARCRPGVRGRGARGHAAHADEVPEAAAGGRAPRAEPRRGDGARRAAGARPGVLHGPGGRRGAAAGARLAGPDGRRGGGRGAQRVPAADRRPHGRLSAA